MEICDSSAAGSVNENLRILNQNNKFADWTDKQVAKTLYKAASNQVYLQILGDNYL